MRSKWHVRERHKYNARHGIKTSATAKGPWRHGTFKRIDGTPVKRIRAHTGHDMLIALRRFLQRNGNVDNSWLGKKRRPSTYSSGGAGQNDGALAGGARQTSGGGKNINFNMGDGKVSKRVQKNRMAAGTNDAPGPQRRRKKKKTFEKSA